MATMNISLPDKMKDWVENQVATGRFANASDYMRDLVRADLQRQEAMEILAKTIEEGLASGISTRTPEELRAWVKQRAEAALEYDLANNKSRRVGS